MDLAVSPAMARPGRHNLPADLTRFIGREPEIAEVKRLLSSSRLLTLAGSAGVGKTRLALKVAAEVVERYRDGVWLVELAPVADPTLVPKTVGLALGVTEQSARPIREALVDVLGPKYLLLILDNCEHLVQACADLVDTLLRASPDLRVLATSRQSLHVPGETTWRVPSLALPPTLDRLDGKSLTGYDATRLFVERAVATLPSFAVAAGNAAAIARICSHLDGIPLAIGLAAARVAVLSLDQIDDRLSDRFRLLTDGSRTALPRQQTLRATLDWSFGLLTDRERVVFRRLAVFAGGWTLEAAEAVCGDEGVGRQTTGHDPHPNPLPEGEGDPSSQQLTPNTRHLIPPADVLDLLAGLVDKSLAIADETGGSVRYRLLETMREYGWEKLRAAGEEALIRDRHRAYVLALAEDADRRLRGFEQAALLARLEREHANLRAALGWCLGGDRDRAAGLRLAGALAWFWRLRGHIGEGRRWLDRALAAPAAGPVWAQPRALTGAGLMAWGQGDYRPAIALFEESLALSGDLGDEDGMAWALHGLGRVAYAQSDYERTAATAEASLIHFEKARDVGGSAYAVYMLANVARARGERDRATRLYEEALVRAREGQDTWGIATVLFQWGNFASIQGNYEQAATIYREGLALFASLAARWGIAICLWGLTGVTGAQGWSKRAARLNGAELALRQEMGLARRADPSAYEQGVAAARAALGEAGFDAAAAEGRAMTVEEIVAYALADDDVERLINQAQERPVSSTFSPLTPRERQVAVLVARGASNRAIAAALIITPRTADTHVMNILTKLELHSRAQVAAWAAEHGLLATDM